MQNLKPIPNPYARYNAQGRFGSEDIGIAPKKELLHVSFMQLVCDALDIPYNERRIVGALLSRALASQFQDMLSEYLHSELKIIAKEFERRTGIPCCVNTKYATHAKFSSFTDTVKKALNLVPKPELDALIADVQARIARISAAESEASDIKGQATSSERST